LQKRREKKEALLLLLMGEKKKRGKKRKLRVDLSPSRKKRKEGEVAFGLSLLRKKSRCPEKSPVAKRRGGNQGRRHGSFRAARGKEKGSGFQEKKTACTEKERKKNCTGPPSKSRPGGEKKKKKRLGGVWKREKKARTIYPPR